MKPEKEIKTIGMMVRDVLRTDKAARNSDMHLIFKVWKKQLGENGELFDEQLSISLVAFRKLANPESIIRFRAKIQNDETMFLPSNPKVRKLRRIKEETYHKWAQTNF